MVAIRLTLEVAVVAILLQATTLTEVAMLCASRCAQLGPALYHVGTMRVWHSVTCCFMTP